MLEAFDVIKLVEKLPLKICAIATWGDHFMLSTVSSKNEAHLLVYKVIQGTDYDKIYEAKLDRTLKKFTSKPVNQLAVIPEHHIFLALASDGELYSADLAQFAHKPALPRTRNVSCFAVDWHKLKSYQPELRICVATKKKILVFSYRNQNFITSDELSLPENARSVSWVGDGLIVCIKKDLYHLTLDGDSKELFSIGQNRSEPVLLPITKGEKHELLVLKDEKQISLDKDAKPTQSIALIWSDMPLCIEHVHPYILGVLPKGIEVKALEQKLQVQSIKMMDTMKDQVKFIVHDNMTLVASHTQVYKLEPRGYDIQVGRLVQLKHFELALEIAELIKETEEDRKMRRMEILRRYAFYLFTQHKFEQSLKIYLEIKEDPVNVISLYPHLLPSELRATVTQPLPAAPPVLTGDDLKKGTEHLISYLTQIRYQVQQDIQQPNIGNSDRMIAQVTTIDTTLLKCYIKTGNSTLIGSLVRLPDNHLHLTESERVLRNEEKYQELVQLFRTKGKHSKALELLHQFHKGPTGPLSGVWPTIDYLQNVTKDHIDLILKYSKWVLKLNPDEGIKIFTEEIGEVENLPRGKIYDHITACAPQLTIPYLEHIIHRWSDKTPKFHNTLILIYKKQVEERLPKYLQMTKGRPRAKAGEEPDELGLLRSKLLNFLQSSQYYEPEALISKFPPDDLFEERALLLGHLGQHDVALAIYAHVLHDPKLAEDYCHRIYDPENEENKEVYLSLVKMYFHPPSLTKLGIRLPKRPDPERNVEKAMMILSAHHEKIDAAKVLDMLPSDTTLESIKKFLLTVLEERTVLQRKTHVLRSLQLAEHLQVQRTRIKEQSPHFIIDESTLCNTCYKRLSTSAFARHPSGVIVHLYCYQQEMADKQEDEDFQNSYSLT